MLQIVLLGRFLFITHAAFSSCNLRTEYRLRCQRLVIVEEDELVAVANIDARYVIERASLLIVVVLDRHQLPALVRTLNRLQQLVQPPLEAALSPLVLLLGGTNFAAQCHA